MNASQCDKELVERLSELAKIGVDPAETEKLCGDLQRIASYLGSLGGLSNELRGVEPLYHVWEELGVVRGEGEKRTVSISYFADDALEEGYVRAPWRGRRR